MKIDETPEHIQAIDTATGAYPPTPETIDAVGGMEPGVYRTPTQADLDRRAAEETAETITEGQSLSPTQASLRRLGRDRRAMFFTAVVLIIIVVAYVGPLVYTRVGPATITGGLSSSGTMTPREYHNYVQVDVTRPDASPSALHLLGTDAAGRDTLARIMAGVNVSIEVALLVEIFDITLGLVVGTLAGYYGGWLATFLDRFTDVMFAFPGLLFAILAAATVGPIFQNKFGLPGRLILVSLALGIVIWPFMARLVRGQTLQLREQQFIEAARTAGSSDFRIITQHIIPNLFNIVVVAAALDTVNTIVGEAVISLLGLGVQPPGSSLGLMISEATSQMLSFPMEIIWPTLALVILVLAFSFMGDGIQDAFNPRTKD